MRRLALTNRHPRLRLDRRALHTLDAHAGKFRGGCPPGELSLVFLTDAALARLHADFLGDPSVTDVITFEGDAALGTAGEICVSADAALRRVGSHFPSPAAGRRAFDAELTLYIVHGWLHLAGFDDLEPRKKRAMRRAEKRALELLTAGGGLPRFQFP
jgi:probable rRNA maturation factor